MPAADWSVIVLAGGRATRLGGIDKSRLALPGGSSLGVLLAGLPDDARVVVAGPEQATSRPVTFVAEEVPFGGPVAGIAAGLPHIHTPHVVVLAVDAPWSVRLIPTLLEEMSRSGDDVVVPVTGDGRRQLLCSAWNTAALRAAVAGLPDPHGVPVRDLVGACLVREWPVPASTADLLRDIDTPEDLARARGRFPGRAQ